MEVERRQNISFWIATELLAEEGCIVETANDGVACVDMIEKADADYYKMILMDIQMPVMNGCSSYPKSGSKRRRVCSDHCHVCKCFCRRYYQL